METWVINTILASDLVFLASAFWYVVNAINDIREKKADKDTVKENIKEINEKISTIEKIASQNVVFEQQLQYQSKILVSVAKQVKAQIPEL